jgi:ankyrin repeat protein
MRVLIAAGADPKLATGNDTINDVSALNRRAAGGITALMAAAGLGSKEEDTTGRFKTEADAIEAIAICLEAGADVNAADTTGRTALHGAAQKGYDQVVTFLTERGGKLDAKDRRGLTPLDAAMGALGNGGFDGSRVDVHESTARLIRELMAKSVASR